MRQAVRQAGAVRKRHRAGRLHERALYRRLDGRWPRRRRRPWAHARRRCGENRPCRPGPRRPAARRARERLRGALEPRPRSYNGSGKQHSSRLARMFRGRARAFASEGRRDPGTSCSDRFTEADPRYRTRGTGIALMMTMAIADRPFLGSVRSALTDRIRFCSRCGVVREEREVGFSPPDVERVCADCGMGVMLVCGRDALPAERMAFLIVTEDLRISAVSEAAERIFGSERELVGSMLFATLTCPLGLEELATRVARAAGGDRDVVRSRSSSSEAHGPASAGSRLAWPAVDRPEAPSWPSSRCSSSNLQNTEHSSNWALQPAPSQVSRRCDARSRARSASQVVKLPENGENLCSRWGKQLLLTPKETCDERDPDERSSRTSGRQPQHA